MNSSRKLTVLVLLLISSICYSQISGNQVYKKNNYGNKIDYKQSIISTDTTMVLSANVLMNKIPDRFIITLGVNQEGKTIKECNELINSRINKFKKKLTSIGVTENDTYIDFISSTKIYDFNISNSKAEQIEKGFEIKKNIIINLKKVEKVNSIIELSAEQEIYDIIKVDYINNDNEKIYYEMYQEALSIISMRKELYIKTFSPKLNGTSRIVSDNFYSISPKTQYQTYQAFETSNVSTNYKTEYIKKTERKNKSFFYEGVNFSGFDRIINGSQTQIGIQYILKISILYNLKKINHRD
ncbi:SIMPL domain-containing protein [Tenacibaculum finnmarkense genomovar ulcerans]|uniref:SIMPL domain-containing protein n=1 Tax=Tenacibaculum finnmarkense TaxID=2781243 RepID=UPI001E34B0D6|nr:SIMPL domain-containing protein [Tenacibaculum finnmarkense]MCD8433529.1 SIMPL domain-containing protein [Tenacibaculum finnmarkense genomovar ulcerans]